MNHARIGWAHLASAGVSDVERRDVSRALPILVRLARAAWTASSGATPDAALGHGSVSDLRVAQIFEEVLNDVVVPGLRLVGVDAALP